MYWLLLGSIGLLAIAGFLLVRSQQATARRDDMQDRELVELRTTAVAASDTARRAHLRIDHQQETIEAVARDIGWSDERARTKVLTATALPPPKKR